MKLSSGLCAVAMSMALLNPGTSALAQTDPSAASDTQSAATQLSISTPANDPLAFDQSTLEATTDDDVVVIYTNDSPIPHNWHLFGGADANAPSIAQTPLKTGPGGVESVKFTVPSDPGSYFYECDIHPVMNGQLVVSSPD